MAQHQRCLHNSAIAFDLKSANTVADGALISLIDVLPYLGPVLGLQGLACLASSNRQLRQECNTFINENATCLLIGTLPAVKAEESLAAVAKAAVHLPTAGAAGTAECLKPVMWLVWTSESAATSAFASADVLQRLLHLPHVPMQQAMPLVAAGVRISYQQLLAAARRMVTGVEVWVQAQQQLGIVSDLPAAAVAICCGQDWVRSPAAVMTLRFCMRHLHTV
jgi:hypothetical protein